MNPNPTRLLAALVLVVPACLAAGANPARAQDSINLTGQTANRMIEIEIEYQKSANQRLQLEAEQQRLLREQEEARERLSRAAAENPAQTRPAYGPAAYRGTPKKGSSFWSTLIWGAVILGGGALLFGKS